MLRRAALALAWLGILVGLAIRLWRAPTTAGSYDSDIDTYLYLGRRLLQGSWMYVDGFNAKWPIIQPLFAPAAALGSIRAHRLLVFALNLAAGLALAAALREWGRQGLVRLAAGSAIPLGAAVLWVVLSQKLVGGLSGHLHQFANGFMAAALLLLAHAGQGPRLRWRRLKLALAGGCLVAALAVRPNLLYALAPPALTLVVLQRSWRRPQGRSAIAALAAGGLTALLLIFLPYLLIPDGPAQAWAGAVLLPLEWSQQRPEADQPLAAVVEQLSSARAAGLSLGTLVLLALPGLALLTWRAWRDPAGAGRLLQIPTLALLGLGGLVVGCWHNHFWLHYVLLSALPITLLLSCSLAALPSPATAAIGLALSLIGVNNILIAESRGVLNQHQGSGRAPAPDQQLLERERLLTHLAGLPPAQRHFTSPQDFSYHWQLGEPASTAGVHPSWSLDPYGMKPSWASRRLGLAITAEQACAQLRSPRHQLVIWSRSDRGGRHALAFTQHCLTSDPQGGWQEISGRLGLRSGRVRVFRRPTKPSPAGSAAQPMPVRAMSSTSAIERIWLRVLAS